MLKIESDRGQVTVACGGPTIDVVADLGAAVASIYQQLKKTPTTAAKEFRDAVLCLLDANSPVWSCSVPEDPNAVTIVVPQKKK